MKRSISSSAACSRWCGSSGRTTFIRYLVQPVVKGDPYKRAISTKQASGYTSFEVLSLSYGPAGGGAHDAGAAVDELLDGLAEHSRDVPLALTTGGTA